MTDQQNEPRQFSIKMKNDGTNEGWIYETTVTQEPYLSGAQVIEYSAFLALKKENERLQKELDQALDDYQDIGKELNEQCRINGIGQQRELKLVTIVKSAYDEITNAVKYLESTGIDDNDFEEHVPERQMLNSFRSWLMNNEIK